MSRFHFHGFFVDIRFKHQMELLVGLLLESFIE